MCFGLFLAFNLVFSFLYSHPKELILEKGSSQKIQKDNSLEIHATDRSILSWDSFSIEKGEVTRFILPSEKASVFNHVRGKTISEIFGALESNGSIYLSNPNGIIIGPEGRIDVASFVATTFSIHPEELLEKKTLTLKGESVAPIQCFGSIHTSLGPVVLAAHRIEVEGTIKAPGQQVHLLSSHEALFDPTGDGLLFIQPKDKGEGIDLKGKIDALKVFLSADTSPTSSAINLEGIVEANAMEFQNGEVYLIAKEGDIDVTGKIALDNPGKIFAQAENGKLTMRGNIASSQGTVHLFGKDILIIENAHIDISGPDGGGTLLVGADRGGKSIGIPNAQHVWCDETSLFNLDANEIGNGGKAVFWGDKGIAFQGYVSAMGGPLGGDGGFVEVSSPNGFAFKGKVCTLAPMGKVGRLLLDPATITISSTSATSGGSFVGGTFTIPGANATVNTSDIETQLGLGNVTIDATSQGAGGSDQITTEATSAISWSANELELIAGTIVHNGDLNLSGSASLSYQGVLNTFAGTLTLEDSATFTESGVNSFNFTGTITLSSSAPSFAVTAASSALTLNGDVVCTSDTDITFSMAGGTFSSTNGTITCSGNGDVTLSTNGAFTFNGLSVTSTGTGDISIDWDSNSTFSSVTATTGGDVTLDVGSVGITMEFVNCTLGSTGGGTLTIDASNIGTILRLDGCSLYSSALTLNPNSLLEIENTLTINATGAVTLTSATEKISLVTAPTTIDTSGTSLSIPKGANSTGGAGKNLVISATGGSVSIAGSSTVDALSITATGNVSFADSCSFTVNEGALSVNTSGSILIGDSATVQVSAPSSSNLLLQAGGNIQVGNGFTLQGSGACILIANSDILSTGTAGTIQTTGTDNLILVADNANPNPPDLGGGKIKFATGYTLCTSSCSGVSTNGTVELYSSLASGNTFPSTINTLAYSAGVNEFSGYWYQTQPPPSANFFVIAYKTPATSSTPSIPENAEIAVTETVNNADADDDLSEGILKPPAVPNPKTACKTPSMAVQSL